MKLVFLAAEHPPLLLGQGIHRIGSAAEADVLLSEDGVHPNHAELYVGPHGVSLRPAPDAAVKVNDRAVVGLIAVRGGDVLTIGQVQMRLDALSSTTVDPVVPDAAAANAAALNTDADDLDEERAHNDVLAATRVLPALPRYVLRGISSAGFGRTFPIVAPTVVGRSAECDIQLDQPGLSRQQARLTPTADGLLVEDLGSTNGTLLNEEPVTHAVAHHGDEIGFDVMRFRLVSTVAPEHDPGAASTTARSSRPAAPNRLPWMVGGVAIAVLLLILLLVAARLL